RANRVAVPWPTRRRGMMVGRFAAPIAAGAVLFLESCCTPREMSALPVTLHPQETSMWCWAASGQMVMDYLGHDQNQCTQAKRRFGRHDCGCNQCASVAAESCVTGGWPEFDKYGFTFQQTNDAPLSWADVRAQTSTESGCKRTPFTFSWHWAGGGGH